MDAGLLKGIARHDRPRGPIETVSRVRVTEGEGVHGDLRGALRPGKTGKRQITLMEAESWTAAMAELGLDLPWRVRRANLLVEGLRLPREPGAIIRIGDTLRIRVTCECDPCNRMDEIAPGLKVALLPDWRGGVCGKVISDGDIAIGDEVRIET
ncbi:MOSC domain-containing protein [Novosphingobium sp. KCTC 2891]|uniref:MOSC domain-containing protein n=1 Tax=Novosphingobium sp. KCTC 2891 TaxID=2989730 RepID=UPI00222223F6|nr:MOSC domain-containing protein [Novosphingobium sp. KCTC 2891]MCW1383366.1 MOSC domain-containing protein [Novosphingobium sp. KCTC 2891]